VRSELWLTKTLTLAKKAEKRYKEATQVKRGGERVGRAPGRERKIRKGRARGAEVG